MLDDGNNTSSISDYKIRIIPDSYTFNTLFDTCITEKRWDDFEYVYKRMLHQGFHFNAKRHLRMILDACKAGKVELLDITWMHLTEADRIPPPPLVKEGFCTKLEKDDCRCSLLYYQSKSRQTSGILKDSVVEPVQGKCRKVSGRHFRTVGSRG
ncbi:hypothetical protein ACFX2J_004554 [Malus domestica]